jgi:hypothetical protein
MHSIKAKIMNVVKEKKAEFTRVNGKLMADLGRPTMKAMNTLDVVIDGAIALAAIIIVLSFSGNFIAGSSGLGANTANNFLLGIQSWTITYWLPFLVAVSGIVLLLLLVYVRNYVRRHGTR